jgi:hypothetical protein
MPVPFARPLQLTDDERQSLAALARAHSTPQALALRCRLILRVAAPEAPPNLRVAADMHCHRQTVRLWRTGSLVCKMRPGLGGRGAFPSSERIDVLALATSTPADHHSPATRWSIDDRRRSSAPMPGPG